jgi:hypothetical protein
MRTNLKLLLCLFLCGAFGAAHSASDAPQYRAGPPAGSATDRLSRQDADQALKRAYGNQGATDEDAARQERIRVCTFKGAFYAAAATSRDQGQSPQDTFAYIKSLRQRIGVNISDQYIKTAINQVYFDPGFLRAGGTPLQYQVMQACAANKPLGFQPLK